MIHPDLGRPHRQVAHAFEILLSDSNVKTIFKIPTLPSHRYNAQVNLCTWFTPNSQATVTLGIRPPDPGLSYTPGAKAPGVTIDKEPTYSKTAFMWFDSTQTFFDYQQVDGGWVLIQASGASPGAMLTFAKAIRAVVH